MKISTKGRYALRLMLDIALNEKEGEPVRIKDVARRQELSCKYLEQIISALHKAGFVRSIRGPQGGYLLTKAPSQYTAGMILRLTEGSLSPVSCLDGEKNRCGRLEECATLLLWQRLNDAINQVVDTVTLQDLIEWHHNRNADNTAEE